MGSCGFGPGVFYFISSAYSSFFLFIVLFLLYILFGNSIPRLCPWGFGLGFIFLSGFVSCFLLPSSLHVAISPSIYFLFFVFVCLCLQQPLVLFLIASYVSIYIFLSYCCWAFFFLYTNLNSCMCIFSFLFSWFFFCHVMVYFIFHFLFFPESGDRSGRNKKRDSHIIKLFDQPESEGVEACAITRLVYSSLGTLNSELGEETK